MEVRYQYFNITIFIGILVDGSSQEVMPKLIIEIDESLKRRIKLKAVHQDVTIKTLVTRVLEEYLEQDNAGKQASAGNKGTAEIA